MGPVSIWNFAAWPMVAALARLIGKLNCQWVPSLDGGAQAGAHRPCLRETFGCNARGPAPQAHGCRPPRDDVGNVSHN